MLKDRLLFFFISGDRIKVKWNVSSEKLELVQLYYGKPFSIFRKALRLYDVSKLEFNGSNAHDVYEVMIRDGVDHWIVKGLKPNSRYFLEYGIKLSETEFFPLLRSENFIASEEVGGEKRIISTLQYSEQNLPLTNDSLPVWIERVSTYSYYESTKPVGEGK